MRFAILLFFTFLIFSFIPKGAIRNLSYKNSEIKTTFSIEPKFYGTYKGKKSGYLKLNEDGTGEYMYDYDSFRPKGCEGGPIKFKWGFIINNEFKPVSDKRDYGHSYPIIYNCTGENSFQGCSSYDMVDYILVYNNGTITVSSSDDWVKVP